MERDLRADLEKWAKIRYTPDRLQFADSIIEHAIERALKAELELNDAWNTADLWKKKYDQAMDEINDLQHHIDHLDFTIDDQKAKLAKLQVLLKEVLPMIEEQAETQIYGGFCAQDPRDFVPDFECSTDLEITRWKDACAQAEKGEPFEDAHHKMGDGYHISYNPWGLGINTIRDPEMMALRDRIKHETKQHEQALDEMEGEK